MLNEILCVLFAGKSKKASRSSRSSAGLQSPDYPTLPMTLSTEALHQNNKNQRTKFPKSFFIKPTLKGFNLLGLRRTQRQSPIPSSRSCEDLDGSPQPAGPLKRSHSLGDLHWEQNFEQKDLRMELTKEGPKSSNTSPSKVCREEGSHNQNGAPILSPKRRADRPPIPSQLTLHPPCAPSQSQNPSEPLSSPTPSPPESSGERIIRTHLKKPPVPPPVPAKKSKERLANGLRHSPLSLPSSPSPTPSPTHSLARSQPSSPIIRSSSSSPSPSAPALPAKTFSNPASPCATTSSASSFGDEPGSPPAVQPPWMSDFGGKVAVSRKVSHNKMSPDLLTLLEQRLEAEGIDLTEEPYSDKVRKVEIANGCVAAK